MNIKLWSVNLEKKQRLVKGLFQDPKVKLKVFMHIFICALKSADLFYGYLSWKRWNIKKREDEIKADGN